MRITSVSATQPSTPTSPKDWRTWMGQILVVIETEDGLTGYGVGGGGQAGIHVVETALRHALVGQQATDVEVLWELMYSLTLPYGQKGLAIMAMSGVDLALWDLRAKRAGLPLADLLADRQPPGAIAGVKTTVPAYCTGRPVEQWLEQGTGGYSALKLSLGMRPGEDVGDVIERFRRVRNTLGPDVTIMGDAFMTLDVESTLGIADGLAPLDIGWIEEPLLPNDHEGYARLRDECPIPIAGGEHEYTAAAFDLLIRERLHTIFQPDVCWCGGLTELIKIYQMARQYNVQVCPHRGSEVWSLHAICALDPNPLAESGRPWMTWVKGQPVIEKGEVTLGDGNGFGVWFEPQDLAS
jgi:L-rhamnonate dehydratase